MAKFAAIGTDGVRPVVWGLGDNEDDALAEAHSQLREAAPEWNEGHNELTVHPVTDAQVARIQTGDVSWPAEDK